MTKSLEKVEKDPAGDQLQALRSRAFAPLREPAFRRIWTASLLANFGQLILGVGVAWKMTRLTSSASMVALVQTAMMLLLMLVALPAGALANMFDRRKVAMLDLCIAAVFGSILSTLAFLEMTTPWMLLGSRCHRYRVPDRSERCTRLLQHNVEDSTTAPG